MSIPTLFAPDALPVPEPMGVPIVPAVPMSVEEYLAFENASEIRHEYVGGKLIPMAGESFMHNQIGGNCYLRLGMAFLDRDCAVYMEGIRLRVSPTTYRYPDVMALCGEQLSDGGNPPALVNPNLIIEVLSPSTQTIDQEEKRHEYWQIASVTDYVLAAQDRVFVMHCVRQEADQWHITEYTKLTDSLTFASLDATLTLADIYRKVVFAPEESSVS